MIAVDTNLLVYAHRKDSAWHEPARDRLARLAEGRGAWALPWPCIHEFYSVVTNPRIYSPPTDRGKACQQIEAWLSSPSLVLLAESGEHWEQMRGLLDRGQIVGPKVHDARIAALCLGHGVRELLTADRDFGRFPELATRNPLIQ